MTLSVAVQHRFNGFDLNVAFDVGPGVTALFGRSGAGKTTVIKSIAGLLRPDAGRISVAGVAFFDADRGINLPSHHRRVGYVFQDARLFPHMSVAANLRYGGSHDAARVIHMLGLDDLLDRRPSTLSGGEVQRVALGRALMSDPRVLLMDEPLAALDAPRKADILPYLERLRDAASVPIVYVSHDVSEVARLANSLVVLEAGQVVRTGPVEEVLADPAAVRLFGVREAGAVILGRIAGYDPVDGLTTVTFDGGEITVPGRLGEAGQATRIRIAAQDVILSLSRPVGISALNILPVRVVDLRTGTGPGVAVSLAMGETRLLARVTRRSSMTLGLAPGQSIFAIVKANAIAPQDVGQARDV